MSSENRDQLSEPVRKIIEENPGLTLGQIADKFDYISINDLRGNHMQHLKKTGQIENRARKGLTPRWYIKEKND
jgi:hypothetical protein